MEMRIEQNYSLAEHNTFHLPVKTRWFMEYASEEELGRILRDEYFQECFSLHIGGGSNLLFINDFNGIILHSCIKGITCVRETDESVFLRVGAAEVWDEVVAYAVERGWGGIENLSLIPGETGAAAVQNIGAYGSEISQAIHSVRCYDTAKRRFLTLRTEDCGYGYRDSFFKHQGGRYVITGVILALSRAFSPQLGYGNVRQTAEAMLAPGEALTPLKVRKAVISIRNGKLPDPADVGSAGSFFKNPVVSGETFAALLRNHGELPHYDLPDGNVKIPAGWLVEQCGWKGRTVGNAGVYPKQALVLTNATGKASPAEIIALKDMIIKSVLDRFGITLVPEVEII